MLKHYSSQQMWTLHKRSNAHPTDHDHRRIANDNITAMQWKRFTCGQITQQGDLTSPGTRVDAMAVAWTYKQ